MLIVDIFGSKLQKPRLHFWSSRIEMKVLLYKTDRYPESFSMIFRDPLSPYLRSLEQTATNVRTLQQVTADSGPVPRFLEAKHQ